MKVWVVLSDCGLNGPWVHGVYSTEPDQALIDEFIDRQLTWEMDDGRTAHGRVTGTTGYQTTFVEGFEIDGELR